MEPEDLATRWNTDTGVEAPYRNKELGLHLADWDASVAEEAAAIPLCDTVISEEYPEGALGQFSH